MCVNCNNNACGGCQPKIPQGLPGANGKNAFTYTANTFTMPDIGSNVTITVQNTGQYTNQWAVPGQVIFIEGAGYFEVVSKTGTNQIVVTNLGYTGNVAPLTLIGTNASVSPAGLIGPTGPSGGSGANGTTSIYADTVPASTSTINSPTTIKSVTIPANTWATFTSTNADSVVINLACNVVEPIYNQTAAALSFNQVQIWIDNNLITNYLGLVQNGNCNMRVILTRKNNNLFFNSIINYFATIQNSAKNDITVSSFNFSNPLNLDIKVYQQKSNNIVLKGITIDKITA